MPSYKTHIAATIIPSLYTISELDLYNLNPIYPILSLSLTVLGSLLLLPISWIINRIFGGRKLFPSILFYTFIFMLLPLFNPSNRLTYGVVLVSLYVGIVSTYPTR